MKIVLAACLIATAALASHSHAASFDCALARTDIEKAICANPDVSTLDEYLGRYYANARETLKPAEKCLIADQRAWIRTRRNACKDESCLREKYLLRLAELDPLQPGASAIKDIELPAVRALAWIVPPAADTAAAPASKKPSPLVARGSILNTLEGGGDGYVVARSDGKHVLFLPAMFIEPATADILESLIKTGGVYELRGIAEQGSDGIAHFAPGHCVFIHRLPK
jgi:uncharacterized protein